ncbi:MAG: 30S ribosomal protein S16 [Myxococcales bacterium]|jgi:small subunit ribosomal protein S16|nr:30S ribosomal protein S16 [Myxococcales bacterium]
MAVKMRLARVGAKKAPFYRVVVANSRSPRDGRFIEHVGVYDPTSNPAEIRFKMDRVDYWLSQGVEPSDTVAYLITQVKTGKAVILGAAK